MTESPHTPSPADGTAPGAGNGEDPVPPDPDDALIDEIGEESFPASDSPSSWSGPPSES